MRNSKLGCFGFLALAMAVYFLWIAILYVGIPLAIIGGAASVYLFKQNPNDEEGVDFDADGLRVFATVLAGGSLVLGLVSLAGNIYSDDGPFGQRETSPAAAAEETANKPASDTQPEQKAAPREWTGSDCQSPDYDFEEKQRNGCSLSDSARIH